MPYACTALWSFEAELSGSKFCQFATYGIGFSPYVFELCFKMCLQRGPFSLIVQGGHLNLILSVDV